MATSSSLALTHSRTKFFPSPSPSLNSPLSPRCTSLPFPSSNPTPKSLIVSSSLDRNPPSSHRRPLFTPNHIPEPNYVRIFDTTLRVGQQSPAAATLTSKEKLDIARELSKLGFDIIEAGFPAASEDDFEAVKTIAKEVGNGIDENGYVPVICVFSNCNEKDIKRAWEAVKYAKRPRIHTCIATSEIHIKYKLRRSKEEVLDIARNMVRFARSLGCDDVEFSLEDAGRSDREFLYEILGEVIKAGATSLNIPHTVGITMPSEFGQLIADIKANTPGIENIIISTHCQNDLGLSTANTIAGACAGARKGEVAINSIGTRAGNTSMEEVVMALKCCGGLYTGINTQHIVMASKMVEEYTGLHVQPHRAIVGANAFAHESGIHQDGMLKYKGTYEIISPENITLERSSEAGNALGKLCGRYALRDRLKELGYELDAVQLENIFWRFKEVAEQKKRVTDADLIVLVSDEAFQPEFVWKLLDLPVTSGILGLSTATVKLIDAGGREHVASLVRTGPVDSAYKAVDLIIKVEEYMSLHVLPHKASVGANAFAHESGIHQDGMLKYKGTYEIISPENIRLERSSEAGNVLGKLSGRHAPRDQLKELGYDVDYVQLGNISRSFNEVAEHNKGVTEADPIALVSDEVFQPRFKWDLLGLQVTCGTIGGSTAAVKVIDADGREHLSCSVGTAPVGPDFALIMKVQGPKPLLFLLPLVYLFREFSLKVLDWWKKRE